MAGTPCPAFWTKSLLPNCIPPGAIAVTPAAKVLLAEQMMLSAVAVVTNATTPSLAILGVKFIQIF
jgi:hypothetical protein